MSRAAALDRLVDRYLGAAVFTTETALRRLFGVPREEIEASVRRLAARGALTAGLRVGGWPGRWIVDARATGR
jgi:hypothetical protein